MPMQIPQDAQLLRIYIGESDKWRHKPLYEAIVLKARELHLAGLKGEREELFRMGRRHLIDDQIMRKLIREIDMVEARYITG